MPGTLREERGRVGAWSVGVRSGVVTSGSLGLPWCPYQGGWLLWVTSAALRAPGKLRGLGRRLASQTHLSGHPLLCAQPVGVGDTASCHPGQSRGSASSWKFAGRKGCRGGVGIRKARGPGPASTCGSDLWPAPGLPSGPELSDPSPGLGPLLLHLHICPSIPSPPWPHLYRNSIRLDPPPPHS